jgi:hypothetical protein
MRQEVTAMTLQDIISDIHALNEDLEAYERKYAPLLPVRYLKFVDRPVVE